MFMGSKASKNPATYVGSERIEEILAVADKICQGDFEARITEIPDAEGYERDLCLKINEMIDRADAYVRESTACLGFIAKNQYFRRIAEHGMLGAYGTAAREINAAADGVETKMNKFGEMVETINTASQELSSSAGSLDATADGTSERATAVSAAAEEAGTNTQTVAAAAEQLSSSIQEISRQVNESNVMAQDAVSEAEKANTLVDGLAEVSKEIEGVVGLISEISAQTSLLALNATIEAARAGDAGKGFAVVAAEVKTLAAQTDRATEDIQSQVQQIQAATGTAIESIMEVGKKIAAFDESSTAIAAAMEQQGAATQEIARNVQEASSGVGEVTERIVEVSADVTKVKNICGDLSLVSSNLADQAESLSAVMNS